MHESSRRLAGIGTGLAACAAIFFGTGTQLQAQAQPQLLSSATVRSEYAAARLVASSATVRPGDTITVALELQTAPEWHTYWKNPGDSGMATSIAWQLPDGVTASPLRWPAPQRILVPPLASYGYEAAPAGANASPSAQRVRLLSEIRVPANARPGPLPVAGRAEWLECKQICLPGEARLSLSVQIAGEAVPETESESANGQTALLAGEAHRLPRATAGLLAASIRLSDDALLLALELPADSPLRVPDAVSLRAYFFAETTGLVASASAQELRVISDRQLELRVPLDPAAAFDEAELQSQPLRGVLQLRAGDETDAAGWLESSDSWQIAAEWSGGSFAASALRLVSMIAFALLGGLLLNLMPCVLPVLSLKVLALLPPVARAGDPASSARAASKSGNAAGRSGNLAGGLAFSAGVIASFLVLAGGLLALQAAGDAVGWGFQLQSPGFVLVLAAVVLLAALNLLGVFEITGPSLSLSAGDANAEAAPARSFWNSHFAAGVLATVLATPCTAPFMGTAMGFAFAQGALTVLAIFFALGAGMAAPYLALAAYPRALARLPRPGRWMLSFKQATGFLMLATLVWLLWVFSRLTDGDALALALPGALALAAAAWIYGRWLSGGLLSGEDTGGRTILWMARVALGVLVATAIAFGAGAASRMPDAHGIANNASDAVAAGSAAWRPYSPKAVAELRAAGRPVFIDFTADWCLSCKVNEALTFSDERVWERMRALDITAFQADWTRRDAVITQALESYGRRGVPLYVLYGPDVDAQPRILPEVLNASLFLGELEKLDLSQAR